MKSSQSFVLIALLWNMMLVANRDGQQAIESRQVPREEHTHREVNNAEGGGPTINIWCKIAKTA